MKKKEMTNEQLSYLCLELSQFLHAGVDIGDGLTILSEECTDPWEKDVTSQLAKKMDEGYALPEAVKEVGCFPEYFTGLINVGNMAGRLEECLMALSKYYEERYYMEYRIRNAIMYPAIMLMLMLIVIVVLLAKVLPIFKDIYAGFGASLSGFAGGLLAIGNFLDKILPVLLVILAVAVILVVLFAGSSKFRDKISEGWKVKHGAKGLSAKSAQAKFAQALAMGLASGLSGDEAVESAGELLSDIPAWKTRIDKCVEMLKDGEEFAEAVKQCELLPLAETRLLALGFRSGNSDEVMAEIARRLSNESDIAVDETLGKIEPALVIVTSVLVGIILLSVMLPLMNIMTAIG